MRITASILLVFLSGILSALALTIPHGYNRHGARDNRALELESHLLNRLPHTDFLEKIQKRAPPKPPAKPPVKPPAKPPAKPPVKPPVQPVPDKSPFEDLFVNDKYKVPYSTKAEDLCSGLISCKEQLEATSEESELSSTRRDDSHIAKRSRTVKAFDGGMTLKAASYYYAFEIYADPRHNNPKAVLEFQTGLVADHKMAAKIVEPASTLNLITEHIIELQTIPMFLDWLANGDKVFQANLKKLWEASVDLTKAKALANVPWTKELTGSLTFNALIFHAMGSKINPNANVLFNKEVNGIKESIWSEENPVAPDKYKTLYQDVAKGKTDSAKLHSVHRNVLAVFDYLQSPPVVSSIQSIVKEITEIMKNAKDLTGQDLKDGQGQSVSLDTKFAEYMKQHFEKTEKWGQKWMKNAITLAEKELEQEIATLKTLEQSIRKKERDTDKTKRRAHFDDSKKKLDALQTARKPIETKIETLKKEVQSEKAKIDKIEAEVFKAKSVAQKGAARKNGKWKTTVEKFQAKEKALLVPREEWNLKLREINKLYGVRVKQVWENFEKDLKTMRDRKGKLSSVIKMPALP